MLLESNNRVERYFLNWGIGSSFASMKGSPLCVFETVAVIGKEEAPVDVSHHDADCGVLECGLPSFVALLARFVFQRRLGLRGHIESQRHLLSDGQQNRAHSAFFTTWGGWGQHRTQGNENVRRQPYCSRLKAWSRQNLTIRPLFLTVNKHNHVRLFTRICISFDFRDAKPKFPVSWSNP